MIFSIKMNPNLENKTPGLNNPETHVLTHNRFNTYMVLIFTDLKKAQIYKTPLRNSHHQEFEIVTKFDYQHLFTPIDLDKKTHARKETNENFLFKIEDKNIFMWGKKLFLKQLMILKNIFQNLVLTKRNILLLSVKKIFITCYFKIILL